MSLMFCANNCSSLGPAAGGGGGGGGEVTVTRAVACCVPPAPFAVSVYVVESAGVTCCEPLACTAPTPSMLTSVAFAVCQVRVVACPFWMVFGFAVSEAVGAGGGGGGGGGGGAVFLWQAPRNRMAPNANTSVVHFILCCFTFPPCVNARRCPSTRFRIQNGAGSLLRHLRASQSKNSPNRNSSTDARSCSPLLPEY